MKSYEIQPTEENVLKTLLEDTVGRNKDIKCFIQMLDHLEDHWSISLDSQWGSGKTFFVKQTKLVLEAFNDYIEKDIDESDVAAIKSMFKNDLGTTQLFLPIYYDAWANDNDDDPILSLIFQITKAVDTYYDIKNLPSFADIGISICSILTGKNYQLLFESLKSTDPLVKIKKENEIQGEINRFFTQLHEERADRVVIFVDELDRCKPTYAVRFLERIKHYFTNDSIMFVFSINSMELQHTIKRFYGNNFNSYEYLNKFFNLSVSLPKANMTGFYSLIKYDCDSNYWYDHISRTVIKHFNFDMRLICQYLQHEKMCRYTYLHPASGTERLFDRSFRNICAIFVPIILGIRMHNISLYNSFINGNTPKILPEILAESELKEYVDKFIFGINEERVWSLTEADLMELYNTIMNYPNSLSYRGKAFGYITIDNKTKENILMQTELISEQSDLLKEKK